MDGGVDAGCSRGKNYLQADLPAPEGPIIKILRVGRDSSDAISI